MARADHLADHLAAPRLLASDEQPPAPKRARLAGLPRQGSDASASADAQGTSASRNGPPPADDKIAEPSLQAQEQEPSGGASRRAGPTSASCTSTPSPALGSRPHPHHIRPLGNALGLPASQLARARQRGLGPFARFSDEALLEEVLPRVARAAAAEASAPGAADARREGPALTAARALARLAQTSRAFHAYAAGYDPLWRELFLELAACEPCDGSSGSSSAVSASASASGGRAPLKLWLGSWRATFVGQLALRAEPQAVQRWVLAPREERARRQRHALEEGNAEEAAQAGASDGTGKGDGEEGGGGAAQTHIYSDALFHPFLTASLPFEQRFFPWIADEAAARGAGSAERGSGEANGSSIENGSARATDTAAASAKRPRRAGRLHQRVPIARVSLPRDPAGDAADAHKRFFDAHCRTGTPAIIAADATDGWPCRAWSVDELVRRFGSAASADGEEGTDAEGRQEGREKTYAAEALQCSLATYRDYARSCAAFDRRFSAVDAGVDDGHQSLGADDSEQPWEDPLAVADESPAYLFDASFAGGPRAADEWRVPEVLRVVPRGARMGAAGEPPGSEAVAADKEGDEDESRRETMADLFRLFGPDRRPDYRWIIAGPRRSGSGWHKDPNMTSAWNAVMRGSKLWLLLPPDVCPPGVYVSADEAEVTAPVSIAEWLLGFYEETKKRHGPKSAGGDGKLLEGVCWEGETMYVPSGWWHLVINLEECVALTQNFVSVCELPTVLRFLRDKPDQISGFKGCDDSDSGGPQAVQNGDLQQAAPATQLFEEFCSALRKFDERLLEKALAQANAQRDRVAPVAEEKPVKKSAAASLASAKADGGALSFALSAELDEELDDVPW